MIDEQRRFCANQMRFRCGLDRPVLTFREGAGRIKVRLNYTRSKDVEGLTIVNKLSFFASLKYRLNLLAFHALRPLE